MLLLGEVCCCWVWAKEGETCSWEMMGRPSIVTCVKFLGKGPSLPQGSWWCVLRVRSSCLSTERAGLPAGVPSFGAIGISVIPGWTPQLYCCAKSLFTPPFLYSLPPLFPSGAPPSLRPVSPPHSPSSILLPSLLPFRFLSLTPVTRPSLFLGFPLRVTSHFLSICRSIH